MGVVRVFALNIRHQNTNYPKPVLLSSVSDAQEIGSTN